MVTPVTSRTSPSIEGSPLFELPISTEKVASEVDNDPTTQASASSVTQACASLVGGEAVLGNITRVWNDVMPPSHNITVAQSLLTFYKVVTDVNKELYQCNKEVSAVAEAKLKMAYDSIPSLAKEATEEFLLDVLIRSGDKEGNKVDIVDVNRKIDLEGALTSMYSELPCIALSCHQKTLPSMYSELPDIALSCHQKTLLSAKTDQERLGVIAQLLQIKTSDPDITLLEEMLNATVLNALDACSDSFLDKFYQKIHSHVRFYERASLQSIDSKLYLEINGVMTDIEDANFASLLVQNEPRAHRVEHVILFLELG